MRLHDLFRRGGRSLLNAKARTFLTSTAIAVGAFTLTLTFAATAGANDYAEKIVRSNFDPSELIVAKDFKIFGRDPSGFNTPQEYDDTVTSQGLGTSIKRLTEVDIEKIAKTDGVESVRPQYQLTPQFITGAKPGAKRYVATVNAYTVGQRPELRTGSVPNVGQDLGESQVLIPESFVSVLGFESAEKAVGQTIIIQLRRPVTVSNEMVARILREQGPEGLKNLQPFETKQYRVTVRGVTKQSPTSVGVSSLIYLSNHDAKMMNDYVTSGTDNYRKYATAFVRITNGHDEATLQSAQKRLSAMGYNVQSSADTQQFITSIINTLQGIVIGFGVIAVIASVFGIINTQYISVLERTREIGLQKALGMRRSSVALLFTMEAAWIGLLGGGLGALTALVAGTVLNPWLTEVFELGEGNYILIFEPLTIVVLLLILIAIAMLAGLLPALKAAKLDPIEALRTE